VIRNIRLVRVTPPELATLTLVVRGPRAGLGRLRLALWLVRLAGRIGGFKRVIVIREASSHG
jgi:hypothetical protein